MFIVRMMWLKMGGVVTKDNESHRKKYWTAMTCSKNVVVNGPEKYNLR